MSYNTRTTRQTAQSPQSQGTGRGTTQIMYHQQQAGQAAPQSTFGQQQQQQQPFGTPQARPFNVTIPKPPVHEYQNQPLASQPAPTPPKSILKTEVVTPAPAEVEGDDVAMDASGEASKKPWAKKKTPGFKINRKVKRRRLNAKLRKMLMPKNAIMVLNELKSGVKFTFHEQPNVLAQPLFIVNAEVDGKFHVGQGVSKPLAKQSAAENALKALLLEKMAAAAVAKPEAETMEVEAPANGADDAEEKDEKDDDDSKLGTAEDEVPWGSLASFALYKLFLDWQNQGTHVPIAKPSAPLQAAQPLKTAPMKQLPENPTERHPVMLLSQMRPGIKFTEKKREGSTPNLTFTLEVTVEGVSYEGVAKNKKDAKKEAAKAALAGCLGISYENSPFCT